MKKFKFLPPYKSNGRTNFPETQKRSGVYIIKENGKIVYVGHSSASLYKTLYRHFQVWNHNGQDVVTYVHRLKRKKYTVRVIFCTPAQAERLERALVLKYKPRDNDLKYKGYQLNAWDQKVVDTYNETKTIDKCPF